MSNALVVVVLSLLAPPVGEPRDVSGAIQVADRMIRAYDNDAALWTESGAAKVEALGDWYRSLPATKKTAYDKIRSMVRKARCFDRSVRLVLRLSAATASNDGGLVLEGMLTGRVEPVRDYYTRDQKQRIAEIRRAMRDKQGRHQHDMRMLEDNTPYKAERIQRFHDGLVEMGQAVQVLRHQFDDAAEERKASGEIVVVRVVVAKDQAASIDRDRLDTLNHVEVIMEVSDFHIRPPLAEFDRPAALGSFEGKAVQLGGISYRAPASFPGAEEPVESKARPGDEAEKQPN